MIILFSVILICGNYVPKVEKNRTYYLNFNINRLSGFDLHLHETDIT